MKHLFKAVAGVMFCWALVVLMGAEAIWRIERTVPGATITTISDAMWWSVNVCSVGDANIGPITSGGRFVGALLIVVGYACFTINVGIVTVLINRFLRWLDGYEI